MPPVSAELQIGELTLALKAFQEDHKRLLDVLQNYLQDDITKTGTVTYGTADPSTNVINLGHPSSGFWWQVRNIVVGGTDITQAPAGVAWYCIMSQMPQANPPIFSVVDWTKQALPTNGFWGNHEFVLHTNEHLLVIITGGTAGVVYSSVARVEQFHEFVRPPINTGPRGRV